VRTCSKCGAAKALDLFYRHPAGRDGYYGHCADCERARSREYQRDKRLADPLHGRTGHLRSKYGLSLAEFDALLARQGGRCAICHSTDPGGKGAWHVDHDHETGVVRALLCHGCNTGIGALGEDVDRLMAAAAYLLTHRDVLATAF
jgi:hypothetical protein